MNMLPQDVEAGMAFEVVKEDDILVLSEGAMLPTGTLAKGALVYITRPPKKRHGINQVFWTPDTPGSPGAREFWSHWVTFKKCMDLVAGPAACSRLAHAAPSTPAKPKKAPAATPVGNGEYTGIGAAPGARIIIKPGPKTPGGLLIAKNGKCQVPLKALPGTSSPGHNYYGQAYPTVGDFVGVRSVLSAGTVGRITEIDASMAHHVDVSYRYELLDGTEGSCWRYGCYVMTPEQVKEVQDYYIVTEKRPGRIRRQLVP